MIEQAPWYGWDWWWYRVRTGWVYGVPLADVTSAFKLYRASFLKAVPIQSDGDFVHTELVAKATFLTSIMDEIPLTPKDLPLPPLGPVGTDRRRVFRNPEFVFRAPEPALPTQPPGSSPSAPTEPPGPPATGAIDAAAEAAANPAPVPAP
jgi:hypothetical protein